MRAALHLIRDSDAIDLALDDRVTFEPRPVIRGREIVLEDALTPPPGTGQAALGPRVRFVDNVDLVALARLAGGHRHVPDLFEAYCRTSGPAPLPNVIGGLSLLVAAGVLRQRNLMRC
jgi:MYXO-CTERM domain-containing protein